MHQLPSISTAPSVPASLRNIPEKYCIIMRFWTYGFHRLLENLRRSAHDSHIALEHLQDFIYFAYVFYASLCEEHNLAVYRTAWLEGLCDLATYRMAVAAIYAPGFSILRTGTGTPSLDARTTRGFDARKLVRCSRRMERHPSRNGTDRQLPQPERAYRRGAQLWA